MKTKEEIKKWLSSQPWFPEYVDNLLNTGTRERAISFLNGEKGSLTISGAFIWVLNWDEWEKRNDVFMMWLNCVTFKTIEEGKQFYYEKKRYIKIGCANAVEVNKITGFSEDCEVTAI